MVKVEDLGNYIVFGHRVQLFCPSAISFIKIVLKCHSISR